MLPVHLAFGLTAATAACTRSSHSSSGTSPAASTPAATTSPATANTSGTGFPGTFAELGLFTGGDLKQPVAGVTPYSVKVSLWSDTAIKSRYIYLPSGTQVSFDATTGLFTLPVGTTLIKHFARDGANTQPLETRVLRLQPDQTWAAATYQWLSPKTTQQAADVVSVTSTIANQSPYRIPSPTECTYCHQGSQSVLGFTPSELNFLRPDGSSELDALATANVITVATAQAAKAVPAMVDPADTALDIDQRARSYLALNCGVCHNPQGVVTLFDISATANADALVSANYVVPGNPANSLLWQQYTASVSSGRMPLQSVVEDPLGLQLLTDWITNWSGSTSTAAASGTTAAASGTTGSGTAASTSSASGT